MYRSFTSQDSDIWGSVVKPGAQRSGGSSGVSYMGVSWLGTFQGM